MKVIFIPYWTFATRGLSELWGVSWWAYVGGRRDVHEGEHSAADREGEGDDQEHEECHLCYEEQEDLRDVLALFVNVVNCVGLFRDHRG